MDLGACDALKWLWESAHLPVASSRAVPALFEFPLVPVARQRWQLVLKQVLEWNTYLLILFRPLLAFCSNVVIAIIPPVRAEFPP